MSPILSLVVQPLIQHLHHLYEILSAMTILVNTLSNKAAKLTDYM
jgi:hypothetical protein